MTRASWPSSQRDSPPTAKVRAWHGPENGARAGPASAAPAGVSLGPGPTPAGGLQLSIFFVLLEMQQDSEASAGPTHALNCTVNCEIAVAD